MSKGADPNITFDSEQPTLVAACREGPEKEELCLELIKHGANPNAQNKVCNVCNVQCIVYEALFTNKRNEYVNN